MGKVDASFVLEQSFCINHYLLDKENSLMKSESCSNLISGLVPMLGLS